MPENKTPKAKLATNEKYMKTLDRITLWIRQDGKTGFTKQDIEVAAEKAGLSMLGYVTQACKERLVKDGIISP